MRQLRAIGRCTAILGFAVAAVLGSAGPAAAECTFIPPLPKVSLAVATARELFVGEVVANGATWADFTVRVDEVFRGPAKVGDLREFQGLEPNWPWTDYPGGQPYASCAAIRAAVGEHIIVALGARTSGGTLHDDGVTWYQPPTTFNTIGITEGSSREQYGSGGRQLFSLDRLRAMAAIFPPPTDTAELTSTAHVARSAPDVRLVVLAMAAAIGAAAGLRRARRTEMSTARTGDPSGM